MLKNWVLLIVLNPLAHNDWWVKLQANRSHMCYRHAIIVAWAKHLEMPVVFSPRKVESRCLCTLFLHRALRRHFSSLSFLDSGKQNASTCQISEVNGAFSISPLVGSPSSLGIRNFVSNASGQVSRRLLRFASRHKRKIAPFAWNIVWNKLSTSLPVWTAT